MTGFSSLTREGHRSQPLHYGNSIYNRTHFPSACLSKSSKTFQNQQKVKFFFWICGGKFASPFLLYGEIRLYNLSKGHQWLVRNIYTHTYIHKTCNQDTKCVSITHYSACWWDSTWRHMSSGASSADRECCRRWWWQTLRPDRAQSRASVQTSQESSPSQTYPTQTDPPGRCSQRGCLTETGHTTLDESLILTTSLTLKNRLNVFKF